MIEEDTSKSFDENQTAHINTRGWLERKRHQEEFALLVEKTLKETKCDICGAKGAFHSASELFYHKERAGFRKIRVYDTRKQLLICSDCAKGIRTKNIVKKIFLWGVNPLICTLLGILFSHEWFAGAFFGCVCGLVFSEAVDYLLKLFTRRYEVYR